jgi:hypothetical protein
MRIKYHDATRSRARLSSIRALRIDAVIAIASVAALSVWVLRVVLDIRYVDATDGRDVQEFVVFENLPSGDPRPDICDLLCIFLGRETRCSKGVGGKTLTPCSVHDSIPPWSPWSDRTLNGSPIDINPITSLSRYNIPRFVERRHVPGHCAIKGTTGGIGMADFW